MKRIGCVVLAAVFILFAGIAPAQANPGWHGGPRGGAYHGGHAWHGGGWHGGVYPSFGIGIALPPLWVGPPAWWGPAPYYAPPVVAAPAPQVYVQRDAPQQNYWYYCQNPQGYYPYVQQCPGGWTTVAPQAP